MIKKLLSLSVLVLLFFLIALEVWAQPPATGGCCSENGTCNVLDQALCEIISGTYQGDGTICEPNPCPQPPTGGCCLGTTQSCDILTQANCESQNGLYQGDDSNCEGVTCPSSGGCCCPNGCFDSIFESVCQNAGCIYQGDDTMCASITCPEGACCFVDQSCSILPQFECSDQFGQYQGNDTMCANITCPEPSPNDECVDAIPLAVPSTTPGSTTGAFIDFSIPFCGTTITAPGIWYSVTGTGNTMTATTCGAFFDYDTKISVYCKDCEDLTCIDGNDDNCSGGASFLLSTVTWASQVGAEYLVLVHGFSSGEGDFELVLSDDGTPATADVFCLPVGGCCFPDASCSDLTVEAQCAAEGGLYQGDDTSCEGDFIGYTEEAGGTFVDISGTGTEAPIASNSDDNGDVVPLGFTFNFFNDDHTEIGVSSNGYLTFGPDLSDFTNDAIPNSNDPNDLIAPYWDDWTPNQGGTVVTQQFAGPNRLMVQWTDVDHFAATGTSTFQAILFEDGCIEYRYDSLSQNSPTVGIENQDGTDGIDSTGNEPTSIRYCPQFENPIVCDLLLSLDIRPGSCPNPFNNRQSKAVLPIALLGTTEFDPNDVDISTLQLVRADGIGGSVQPNEGPPGPHTEVEDVATPFAGELCDCHELEGDGIDDLLMKFNNQDLVDAGLDQGVKGELVTLCVIGNLLDGTPFEACDCIRLVQPGGDDDDDAIQ